MVTREFRNWDFHQNNSPGPIRGFKFVEYSWTYYYLKLTPYNGNLMEINQHTVGYSSEGSRVSRFLQHRVIAPMYSLLEVVLDAEEPI
jgi:hypothetical protein